MNKNIFLTVLLTSILFLFACGGKNLATLEDGGQGVITEQKELIQKNIKDPGKRTRLLQITSEIEKQSGDFFKFYEDHNKQIARLNKSYTASRQDFEMLNDEFNRQYEDYLRVLVGKRSEMRLLTSEDEWRSIMDRSSSFIPE